MRLNPVPQLPAKDEVVFIDLRYSRYAKARWILAGIKSGEGKYAVDYKMNSC